MVIDGWGIGPAGPGNAIRLAGPSFFDRRHATHAYTELQASGEAVGLPPGQMGNSEVGHLTIGAGRIVDQDIVRISKVVRNRALEAQPAIRDLFDDCRRESRALHLVGLLGPGGVHSHLDHLIGLLQATNNLPKVWVHHVLDGRDTPPQSAIAFARAAQTAVDANPRAHVATVSGRYWTMDRDKRWDRTERAYRMLTELVGRPAETAVHAIEAAYAAGETDEFVQPTVVRGAEPIREGDGVLAYNFRPDRMRQIVRSLVDPAFKDFPTQPLRAKLVTMTSYDQTFSALGVQVAFPKERPPNTLGELYAARGLRQLRIAETEKYAHVTYFFSGGREDPFPGEDRILVPSPKVATYDERPEMRARDITDQALAAIAKTRYDLVVLNFANPDMVGHTGKLDKTVEAVRVVNECLERLAEEAVARGYVLAVTADHGNAESMRTDEGGPVTAHTTNPVPFLVVQPGLQALQLRAAGRLSDVAPTLLRLVGIEAPSEMDGRPLLAAAPGIHPPGSKPTRS